VAREAEVPLAKEGCSPNILVFIAEDADALTDGLRRKYPQIFQGLGTTELKRALHDGPVHVWNTTEVRNEDGQSASSAGGMKGSAPTLTVKTATFMGLPTQQVTLQSIMVMDADALLGKTLNQIADYIALRTLAGARPPQATLASDTILTLFDAETAPPGLTLIDTAFLHGLYDSRATARATMQMGAIASRIQRDSRERAAD
jgi:hypothetical protein